MSRLRLTEMFYSLQGETRTMGLPTLFVRLTGCPLRCVYCDTEYAFTGGTYYEMDDVLSQIDSYSPQYITVTGGEPLAQKAPCEELLKHLADKGYRVSLETSGAMDVSGVDERITKVLDLKTPDSGEMSKNLWTNIALLNPHDEVKFVICSRNDYEWAKMKLVEHKLADQCDVLFSPSFGQQDATELADWIIKDNLPVRFQIQLHKLLWNDEPGH